MKGEALKVSRDRQSSGYGRSSLEDQRLSHELHGPWTVGGVRDSALVCEFASHPSAAGEVARAWQTVFVARRHRANRLAHATTQINGGGGWGGGRALRGWWWGSCARSSRSPSSARATACSTRRHVRGSRCRVHVRRRRAGRARPFRCERASERAGARWLRWPPSRAKPATRAHGGCGGRRREPNRRRPERSGGRSDRRSSPPPPSRRSLSPS